MTLLRTSHSNSASPHQTDMESQLFLGSSSGHSYAYEDEDMGELGTSTYLDMNDDWMFNGIGDDALRSIAATGTFNADHDSGHDLLDPGREGRSEGESDVVVGPAGLAEDHSGPTHGDQPAAGQGSAVDADPLQFVEPNIAAPDVGLADESGAGISTSAMQDYSTHEDHDDVMSNCDFYLSDDRGAMVDDSSILEGIPQELLDRIASCGDYDNSASNVAFPIDSSSNEGLGEEAGSTFSDGLATGHLVDHRMTSPHPVAADVQGAASESNIMGYDDVNYTYGSEEVYCDRNNYTSNYQGNVNMQDEGLVGEEPTDDANPVIPDSVDSLIATPQVGAVDCALEMTSGSSSGNVHGNAGSCADDSPGEAHSTTSKGGDVNLHHGGVATHANSLVFPAETIPNAGPTIGNASDRGKRPRATSAAGAGKKMKKIMVGGKVFKYHGVIERAGCNISFKAYFRPSSLLDSDNRTCPLGEFPNATEAWNAFNLMAFVHEGEGATLNDPDIRSISEEAAAWSDKHRVALLAHLRLRGRETYIGTTTPHYRSIKCSESSNGRITYSCNVTLNPGVVDPRRHAANGEKEKQTFDSAEEAASLADWRKYLNEGEAAWTNFSLAIYMEEAGKPLDKTWLPLTNDPKKYLSTSKRGRSFAM